MLLLMTVLADLKHFCMVRSALTRIVANKLSHYWRLVIPGFINESFECPFGGTRQQVGLINPAVRFLRKVVVAGELVVGARLAQT